MVDGMNTRRHAGQPSPASVDHGGNIRAAADELGMRENEVMDFSASINPLGISARVKQEIKKQIDALCRYPDPGVQSLTRDLAVIHSIDPGSIVCGNGSTEILHLIARVIRPKRVLIPVPTFTEYERAVARTGLRGQTVYVALQEKDNFDIDPATFIRALGAAAPCGAAFLCNPNNPTGRLLRKENVLRIASAAQFAKCYLVVDEAFMDFVPVESVVHAVQDNPYLIVVRSMTKFYAFPGLRLGYGVFPKGIAAAIKQHAEPWSVNTLAQAAGCAAIRDTGYAAQTMQLISREKAFLEAGFLRLGIAYVPSEANYYLLRFGDAASVARQLKGAGILVRECSDFRGISDNTYIRAAVRSHQHNSEFLKQLSRLRQTNKGGE